MPEDFNDDEVSDGASEEALFSGDEPTEEEVAKSHYATFASSRKEREEMMRQRKKEEEERMVPVRRMIPVQVVASVHDLQRGKATLTKTVDLKDFPINKNTLIHMKPILVHSPVTLGLNVNENGVEVGDISSENGDFHAILHHGMRGEPVHIGSLAHLNDNERLENAKDSVAALKLSKERNVPVSQMWGLRARDIEEPSLSDKSRSAKSLRELLNTTAAPEGKVIIGAKHPALHILRDDETGDFGDESYLVDERDFADASRDLKTVVSALTPHYEKTLQVQLTPVFTDTGKAYEPDDKKQWLDVGQDISAHYQNLGLDPHTAYPDDVIRASFHIILDNTDPNH